MPESEVTEPIVVVGVVQDGIAQSLKESDYVEPIKPEPALSDPKAELERCVKRDRRVRTMLTRVLGKLREEDPNLESPLATDVRQLIWELVYVR